MDEEDTNDKCPNNQTPDTLSETGADVTDYFSSRREQMASALSSTAPKHVCVHACMNIPTCNQANRCVKVQVRTHADCHHV